MSTCQMRSIALKRAHLAVKWAHVALLFGLLAHAAFAAGGAPTSYTMSDVDQGSTSRSCFTFTEPKHCETYTTLSCELSEQCPKIAGVVQQCVDGTAATPTQVKLAIYDNTTSTLLYSNTDNAVGAAYKCYTIPTTGNAMVATSNVPPCEKHTLVLEYSTASDTLKRNYSFCVRQRRFSVP